MSNSVSSTADASRSRSVFSTIVLNEPLRMLPEIPSSRTSAIAFLPLDGGWIAVARSRSGPAPRWTREAGIGKMRASRRRGRVVEGTPLLREHTAKKLYRGFESHRLRQYDRARSRAHFFASVYDAVPSRWHIGGFCRRFASLPDRAARMPCAECPQEKRMHRARVTDASPTVNVRYAASGFVHRAPAHFSAQ